MQTYKMEHYEKHLRKIYTVKLNEKKEDVDSLMADVVLEKRDLLPIHG